MKFLIAGKNSYLGRHLKTSLKEAGHSVYMLTHNRDGDISGDTIYFDELDNCREDFDVVINCVTNYGRNNETYVQMLEVNTLYPLKILEWAGNNKIKYFINTATSITSLINPYTLSKRQFSHWGKLYSENNAIKFINVILEHYVGEFAPESNFVTMLLHKMSANEEYINLTQGIQLRDFIYIDDVVRAYDTIINHLSEINEGYFEIEVGSGIPYRIREICEYIKKVLNSKTELRFGVIPYRDNELMYTCSDNTQLMKWGWGGVNYSFEQAIKRIIERENLI